MTILEPTLSTVHLGNNDPLEIRVALEYSGSSMYEIHTIDASGNQLVVPIENENNGGSAPDYYPLDSFNTFSTSDDRSEIYFVTYNQDSYSKPWSGL